MTTDHSESVTASQTDQDHDPAIEFVIRLHAAAKAGKALLEAWESPNVDADAVAAAAAKARAAYDRLDTTEQAST